MTVVNTGEALRYRKLKRAILAGVIISILILLANLYNNYMICEKLECATEFEHDIHELTQRLFAKEQKHNRFLMKVNYQSRTNVHDQDDKAKDPLLELHEDLLANATNSTTFFLRRLFDNYNVNTQNVEKITDEEKQEEDDFLVAIMKTETMKDTMAFLAQKGFAPNEPKLQMQLLYDIWFQQYTDIPGRAGSCSGFEHVFIADLNQHIVVGLHNWMYFHEQEIHGKLNYKGYIEKIDFEKYDQHLMAVRFSFHNIPVHYNTLFVGTSPELELSLYTLCFLMAMNEPCPIKLGRAKFSIITHSWKLQGKNIIGLAYPLIDNEFRPFPGRNPRQIEICQSTLKCLKCKKMHDMKNKMCYN